MKKTLLVACLLLTASLAQAQRLSASRVPAAVREAFRKQFRAAKKPRWETESVGYEVHFSQNGTPVSALFDEAGRLLQTERTISPDRLPQGVLAYLEQNAPGSRAKGSARIEGLDGNVTYEVETAGARYLFSEQGVFMTKVDIRKRKDN